MPLVSFHEVQNEVNRYVGAVLTLVFRDQFPVFKVSGSGIARTLVFGMPGMKQAMFVKTRAGHRHTFSAPSFGIRKFGRIVGLKLPLAGNTGSVTRFLHQVAKGFFLRIKDSKVGPVSMVVFARHDLHTGRRAEWL